MHLFDRVALSPAHVVQQLGFGFHFLGDARQLDRQVRPLLSEICVALPQFFERGIHFLPGTVLLANLQGFLDIRLGDFLSALGDGVLPRGNRLFQMADAALDQIPLERQQLGHRVQTLAFGVQRAQLLVQGRQMSLGLRALSQRRGNVLSRRGSGRQTLPRFVQLLVGLFGQTRQFALAVPDLHRRLAGCQFLAGDPQLFLVLIQDLLQILDRRFRIEADRYFGQRLLQLLTHGGDGRGRLLDLEIPSRDLASRLDSRLQPLLRLGVLFQQFRLDRRLQIGRGFHAQLAAIQLGRRQEPDQRRRRGFVGRGGRRFSDRRRSGRFSIRSRQVERFGRLEQQAGFGIRQRLDWPQRIVCPLAAANASSGSTRQRDQPRGKNTKKRDWLRAAAAKTQGTHPGARCLSQFFPKKRDWLRGPTTDREFVGVFASNHRP